MKETMTSELKKKKTLLIDMHILNTSIYNRLILINNSNKQMEKTETPGSL